MRGKTFNIGPIYLAIPFLTVLLAVSFFGCKKTNQPLGLDAPLGFDRPTLTPTPQTGAIQIYVSDPQIVSGGAMQGVSIALIEPSGNTFSVQATQPLVGYAAFNPPNLSSGIWTAEVPAQSVSFQLVNSGVTTNVKRTYGLSTLPITISSSGQYSATFSSGGNSVAISPVSQAMGTSIPGFLPVTVSYYENGNLDIPVTVDLQGSTNVPGFSWQNPITWLFGGGVFYAPATLVKNQCYYQPLNFTLAASDLSGNPIPTAGASITRGFQIPVTLFVEKTLISGVENEQASIQASNDCGAAIWYLSVSFGGTPTAGYVSNGGVENIKNSGSQNLTFYYSVTCPSLGGAGISGNNLCANINWDSWSNVGSTNY
jgi:hypothetical protein